MSKGLTKKQVGAPGGDNPPAPAKRAKRGAGRPRAIETEITTIVGGNLAVYPFGYGSKKTKGPDGFPIFELRSPDELMARRGFRIYREMRDQDDQVKVCLSFKKALVTERGWNIEPASEDPQDLQVADYCQWVFDKLPLNRILRDMLSCLEFGFSFGELIWAVKPYTAKAKKAKAPKPLMNAPEGMPPPQAGRARSGGDGSLKIVLDDVHHRDPEFIRLDVDIHGNLMNFRQIAHWPPSLVDVPAEKALWLSYQAQFSNHYGISDLKAAYKHWWSKKFIMQFWNVFLERFGQPLMMMKYPQGATPALKEALKQIINGLSTKSDILVPEGVVVELVEAMRAGQGNYEAALQYMDVGISRAILMPALLGGGVDIKRGSDSQSRLHLRTLMKVVNDLSHDIERAIQSQIIDQMVDYNFNGIDEKPKFQFQDYGELEATHLADAIAGLFNAGIIDMDQDDVNYARSVLGLPIRDPDNPDNVIRSMPPPMGTSPNDPNEKGQGGKGGNQRAKKGASQKQGNDS